MQGHTSENVDAIAETSSDDDDTPDDEPSSENDDEFEQELARMMSDNSSVRRSNAKTAISDVNILAIKRQAQAATASDDESVPDPTNMKFTMLLKKGAKQQVRINPSGTFAESAEIFTDSFNGCARCISARSPHHQSPARNAG